MRDYLSKLMVASMVAGAALVVSGCGKSETTNTTDTNMTEMNSMDTSMEGSMNDVTAVDSTAGTDANMMMDNSSMNMADNMSMDSNMSGNGM